MPYEKGRFEETLNASLSNVFWLTSKNGDSYVSQPKLKEEDNLEDAAQSDEINSVAMYPMSTINSYFHYELAALFCIQRISNFSPVIAIRHFL